MRVPVRVRWALGAVVLLLVVVRLLLPGAVQRYVNRTLDGIPDYEGQIGDVDLHLWRGAYEIEDVSLVKTDGKVPVPLFSSPRVDLSVEWGQLFRGKLVGEIGLQAPEINFVSAPAAANQQGGVDASWVERVKELFPLQINRVTVTDGRMRYHDFHSDPKVHLELLDLQAVLSNVRNRPSANDALPSALHATATLPGGGSFKLDGSLAPLEAQPTFSIDTTVEGMGLPALNDFLKAYANVDAERGTFSAYAELAAREGSFEGYVKPLLKDVELARFRKDESIGRRLWEGVVQLAAKALENDEGKVATRVPISGRFDKPEPDLWAAIGGLLRNAFIEGLRPGIEGRIGEKLGLGKKARE